MAEEPIIKEPIIFQPNIVEPKISEPVILEPPIILPDPISKNLPFGLDPLVIEMPGCVEARDSSTGRGSDHFSTDESSNLVLCDYSMPIFSPLDARAAEKVQVVGEVQRPKLTENEGTKKNQNVTPPPTTAIRQDNPPPPQNCPPNSAPPIGSIGKYGRGKIINYRLDLFTGECVTEYEPIKIIETIDHYVPPPALVSGVMITAVFGASSALLAAPLTELIKKRTKPLQKKIIKAVKKKLGKKEKPLSRGEKIRAQREKNKVNLLWRSLLKK